MAHVEHYKMADVKRLANEWTRDKKYKDSENRIKTELTKDNYCMDNDFKACGLKTRMASSLTGAVKARLDEIPHSNRKDLNVLSDWVITCPQELKDDDRNRKKFFEIAYQFCCDRYGTDNVINGYVHMDETTPHVHVSVIPVKDGRVSSKALFTRKELSDFHKELDKVCEVEFGMKGLVLNGRTKGNYTFRELKEREREKTELNKLARYLETEREAIERDREANEKEREANERDRKEINAFKRSIKPQIEVILTECNNLIADAKKLRNEALTRSSSATKQSVVGKLSEIQKAMMLANDLDEQQHNVYERELG